MSDIPLDARDIEQYLTELAEELQGGPQHALVVAGGALLAWHGLRTATHDVDSVQRLDADLVAAVQRVAARHDLAPKWLNDSAAAFLPATFDRSACDVLLEHPNLRVLGLPWDQLFLMKLNASRAVDTADIERIWPRCSFETAEKAVEAFYAAYPLEQTDEYLADYIRQITP